MPTKNPAAVSLGKLGGNARAKALTAAQRKSIAQKAAKARWAKNGDGVDTCKACGSDQLFGGFFDSEGYAQQETA